MIDNNGAIARRLLATVAAVLVVISAASAGAVETNGEFPRPTFDEGSWGDGFGYASGPDQEWVSDAFLEQAELVFAALEGGTEGVQGGSTAGPGVYEEVTSVAEYADEYISDVFLPGTAVIALVGDGNADIDLHVYDADEELLCSSTGYGHEELCEIELRDEQELTIRIDNQTVDVASEFLVWTN